MTAHKHAHLMAQYAQDALETDKPWTRWEVATSGNEWGSLPGNPIWGEYTEYRRKPRTLTYTITIPEPLTDGQIKGLIEEGVFFGNCKEIVRAIEAAHGIGVEHEAIQA